MKHWIMYGMMAALVMACPAMAEDTPPQDPPQETTPVVTVKKRPDIVVRQLSSIEFGTFASEAGGGSITVSPTGARIPSGNVTMLNTSLTGAADFEIIGQPDEIVTIYLPERVTLGRNGGSGNAVITNLTVLPATTLNLDSNGRGRIKVGGTLQVPGHASGSYNGMFDVDVRYLR